MPGPDPHDWRRDWAERRAARAEWRAQRWEERRERWASLHAAVAQNDTERWQQSFIGALEAGAGPLSFAAGAAR